MFARLDIVIVYPTLFLRYEILNKAVTDTPPTNEPRRCAHPHTQTLCHMLYIITPTSITIDIIPHKVFVIIINTNNNAFNVIGNVSLFT